MELLAVPSAMRTLMPVVILVGCIVIDGCTSLAYSLILAMDALGTFVMIVPPKNWWMMRRVELILKCWRSVHTARSTTVLTAREWNAVRLVLVVISMSALTAISFKNALGVAGRCVVIASWNGDVVVDVTKHFVIFASKQYRLTVH